jgi:hypothetical protein
MPHATMDGAVVMDAASPAGSEGVSLYAVEEVVF